MYTSNVNTVICKIILFFTDLKVQKVDKQTGSLSFVAPRQSKSDFPPALAKITLPATEIAASTGKKH